MKKKIFSLLSFFCAFVIAASCVVLPSASADEPAGKMASVYAYTLNDYLFTYGVMSTSNAGDKLTNDGSGSYAPNGVVYAEVINFDSNDNPYLVIFLAESKYNAAACHVWSYDKTEEKANRIAILNINHSKLSEGETGVFSLGSTNEKRYITYRTYHNDILSDVRYYTAIDGEAYEYINEPYVQNEIGIMDFGRNYFHSGVDISDYNRNMTLFFDKLKNASADSVTYEDIAERLDDEDGAQFENVLRKITGFGDFDIADYSTIEDYKRGLESRPDGDRFYLISELYSLGDEIYYVRFSTERSYYNYALLRKSDEAENGYQILKVRTDCIPLSDRELKLIKESYDRNPLLYKKSENSLRPLTDPESESPEREPLFNFKKLLHNRVRMPVICIGSGIAIALLTILWVYLYSDSE